MKKTKVKDTIMNKNANVDELEFKQESKFKRIQRAINCSRMNNDNYTFCDNCTHIVNCKMDKHLRSRLKEIKLL